MKTRKTKRMGTDYHETAIPDQCQCSIMCTKRALPKEAFCSQHLHKCPRESPLSSWEPEYDPSLWNMYIAIKETHNCFSYAMNVFDKRQIAKCKGLKSCNTSFHQPGSASGYSRFSNSRPKTCPNMLERIMGDNPMTYITDFTTQCKENFSKIALIVDESDDYHFLRQDSNGYWSHKPGAQRVKRIDARGHKIWDPKLANYDYTTNGNSDLKYDIFCSYMCVPRNVPLYMRTGGAWTPSVTG